MSIRQVVAIHADRRSGSRGTGFIVATSFRLTSRWPVAVAAAFSLAIPARASVLYVSASAGGLPADGTSWQQAYRSVKAALARTVSGDQVWVARGTYVENVTVGKGVSLYGGFSGDEALIDERDWSSNATILDGSGAGSVVTVADSAGRETVIDGFTIRNGSGTSIPYSLPSPNAICGGGLFTRGGPIMRNNVFTGNTATNPIAGLNIKCFGGAVYTVGGLIENNVFTGNRVGYDGCGGALRVGNFATIRNNTFSANVVEPTSSWGSGGGALYMDGWNGVVQNCTFTGNTSSDGGAMACGDQFSGYVVTACTFTGNSAAGDGGAVMDSSAYGISLYACDLRDNNAGASGGAAWGGVFPFDCFIVHNHAGANGGAIELGSALNCTVADNTADLSGGATYSGSMTNCIIAFNHAKWYAAMGQPDGSANCVYGNTATDNSYPLFTGTNPVQADPKFVDRGHGDYHILPSSPCVDAGDNTVYAGLTDVDGGPRRLGKGIDIGADEAFVSSGFTTHDAVLALRVAAGLEAVSQADGNRLDVVPPTGVDLRDTVRIVRRSVGLDTGS